MPSRMETGRGRGSPAGSVGFSYVLAPTTEAWG